MDIYKHTLACSLISRTILAPIVLSALTLLTACANSHLSPDTKAPSLSEAVALPDIFAERPEIPRYDDIHGLSAEQEAHFLAYMNNPDNAVHTPNLRLYYYLENVVKAFAYEGKTFNASDTLTTTSGNCMSLAILTTALADKAGLEIEYQLMDDVPVYEFNDQLIKKGVHIRTLIYSPATENEEQQSKSSGKLIKIDYFPTSRQRFISNIDSADYLAMYFQNLAVEFLEQERLSDAYWYALEALRYAPDYSPAMNTLAIVHRRAGDADTAEAIYQFGIAHADEKLSLLKNYHTLLQTGGRDNEARDIRIQLAAIDDPSPSHWFQLGRASLEEEDYREAIRYYRKALSLAPYLHEAHFGIAQANYALGQLGQTRAALEKAMAEAEKTSTRSLYEAKLVSLGNSR